MILAGAICLAAFIDVPLGGRVGERTYTPASFAELQPTYRLGIGEIDLDLRQLDFSRRSESILITNGIGQLRVTVPPGVEVVATGHAGAGNVELFDWEGDGTDVDHRVVSPGVEGGGRLELHARVGIGEVVVQRA